MLKSKDQLLLLIYFFVMSNAATQETILKYAFNADQANKFLHYLGECQEIFVENSFNPKFIIHDDSRNNNIGGRNIMYSKKK